MTDLVADAAEEAQTPIAPPRLVKMRGFGIGDRSTLPISIATGIIIVAAWWVASEARLVSRLFLPTSREVVSAAISFYQDGYANASMWEHICASLMRILTAAAIAIALGTPIGLLARVELDGRRGCSIRRSNSIGRCRRSPICR